MNLREHVPNPSETMIAADSVRDAWMLPDRIGDNWRHFKDSCLMNVVFRDGGRRQALGLVPHPQAITLSPPLQSVNKAAVS